MAIILDTVGGNILLDNAFEDDFIYAFGGDDTIVLSDDGLGDTVFAGTGDDTIEISDRTGSNTIAGGEGVDTVDYSNLGESITLNSLGVAKESGGFDFIDSVEVFIGATGAGIVNTIDGSSIGIVANTAFLNVDLASESLILDGLPDGPLSVTVQNFDNVIGTQNDDIIRGDSGTNEFSGDEGDDALFGDGGDDTLDGGGGNDTLRGADNGQGEVDELTGGSGSDEFILGDAISGPLYVGGGDTDFARITDFESVDTLAFDPNTPFIDIPGTLGLGLGDREYYWDLNANGILDGVDDLFAVVDFA
ncbi:hemolysin-type calcium-binding repeat (2 copies) [Rubidibacter lacunae KORDI 51-2]|uniref:Hemolysin-type calcium-binding repeat (2 copies) n=1 Tax=Rubidibacter lacunae KORDI 51-2 TaxID=582515 RepID=U5DJV9_9CHRO|nr:hemolysin-type calcium-binding repeat (2 copies) [Rubidibacter lacunae]ERN40864.1 hemolysin-type calcium-binding repeat (2 copies) [Rubidibacter lacunae KORDI 51-2]